MTLLKIAGIAYVILVCVTWFCLLAEYVAARRVHKLLKPLGIDKLDGNATNGLWKKLLLAPFVVWMFPWVMKNMWQALTYYFHLKSLPEEKRRADYEGEVLRRTFAGMAKMVNKSHKASNKKVSTIENDGFPF